MRAQEKVGPAQEKTGLAQAKTGPAQEKSGQGNATHHDAQKIAPPSAVPSHPPLPELHHGHDAKHGASSASPAASPPSFAASSSASSGVSPSAAPSKGSFSGKLRSLFKAGKDGSKDGGNSKNGATGKSGNAAHGGANSAQELSDEEIARRLHAAHKKPRKKLGRQSLQQYLDKAGYDVNAEKAKKAVFRIVLALFVALTIAILIFASYRGATALNTLVFILALWTAVFAGVLLLVWAAVYFYLDYRIYRRTKELEEVLPDFLQLASSNIAAGMPIDRALWYAIRPNFGVLAKEMEDVAKATMAGEDLEVCLVRLTEKYDSTVLKRSISILIEGLHAGGEMADLLNKIALNIDEMKIMKKEMAANVTTYAIFITFASVVIAPFLFALSTELLSIIIKITGTLNLQGSSSVLSIGAPDPNAVANFKIFSIFMLLISTVFSACIVSVIKRGNIMEGIKTIPVYAAVAIAIYYFSLFVLSGMFSGII
jgi:flagellar protein FlaJ